MHNKPNHGVHTLTHMLLQDKRSIVQFRVIVQFIQKLFCMMNIVLVAIDSPTQNTIVNALVLSIVTFVFETYMLSC